MTKEKKLLFFSQIYLVILSLLSISFLTSRYETIDDLILSDFISGQYTGKTESQLIFISDGIGFLINIFVNELNIYALSQIVLLILIISIYFYFNNISFFKISNLITISCIVIILNLRPSYTITALISSILLVSLLVNPKLFFSKYSITFLISLLILSISIRFEVLYLNILFLLSFILLHYIQFKKFYFKKYFLVLSIFLITALINPFFERFINNPGWIKFNSWNQIRHQIHNRISQFKLDQLLYPGGWSPFEHNLFVDWAYGDPKIFDLSWINIAYDFTKLYRGFYSLFNFEFDYFLFNIERYNFISKWSILFIILLIFSILIFYKVNKKYFVFMVIIYWLPSIIFIIYSGFFLLLPDRVTLPLLLLNTLILIGLNNSKILIFKGIILLLINILFVFKIYQIHIENTNLKYKNSQILNDLIEFNSNAVYFMPECENIYLSENPYELKNKTRYVKILNVGCWDTFSPHWYQKKYNFNLMNESAYDDLFEKDVFWLSKSIPDTSLNIELLLNENGKSDISRSKLKSIAYGYEIYKFTAD